MKNIQALVLTVFCGAALFFTTSASAQQQGVATIVRIHGTATYTTGDGAWQPLMVGMTLSQGAVVKTDPGSTVDMVLAESRANVGLTQPTIPVVASPTFGRMPPLMRMNVTAQQNVIRVEGDSVLAIDKLAYTDTGAETATDTELDLRAGKVFGNVKKLSAMSRFEIKTPTGVAGIRGTAFTLSVDGTVTVYSGSVVVSMVVNGQTVTQVVGAGYQYNPSTGQLIYLVPVGESVDQWAAANQPPQVLTTTQIQAPVDAGTPLEYVSPVK
ncbi:MAG: FecR domain-containing protein [Verrucomicrobiota bacterium]|nr:FecR domain-containing protein [Verrucomicrobiota bacterium]